MEETLQQTEPKWYVLVVLPGQELSIRDKLIALSKTKKFENLIFDVRVPTKTVENKKGQKKEKVDDYTQYVFIKMYHNDETYNGVKIEGVRHILGAPTPMEYDEVVRLFGEF